MKKRIIAMLLVMSVALFIFTACGSRNGGNTDSGSEPSSAGAYFAAFDTEALGGERVTEEIFKGNKITMVNVWGTFCGPCIREMPDLQKISEGYKDKGVRVIGVICDTYDYSTRTNSPEILQDAKDIVAYTGTQYTHLLPSESLNKVMLDSIFSVPTTYFLDENGAIIGTEYVGARSFEQWSEIIDAILQG